MKKFYWKDYLMALPIIILFLVTTKFSVINAESYNSINNKVDFSSDVIYQIIADRFYDGDSTNNPSGEIFDTTNLRKYHGGDWRGIIKKIQDGYLTDLGITAIWISSPVENITSIDPTSNSASYHGYWARDFFNTNSAFGTQEDFKELVSIAHENNIKIVIDFAPNHTSTAEYSGYSFPEDGALFRNGNLIGTFSNDVDGIFNHESWTDYSTYENGIYHSLYGLADLNNINPTIDKYLKDAIVSWIDYGIDGIRVDAVKHMSLGWQKNWLSYIYEKTGIFVFGEWYTGGTEAEVEMTSFANNSGMSLLDFRFANAIRNLYSSDTFTMLDFYNVLQATENDYEEINDQVTFIDNHDMSRFSTLVNGNQLAVNQAYALLLTSRGVPTIYYGSEQYDQGGNDPENRSDISSFNKNSNAYKVISKLSNLRKHNQALAYGTTQERWINSDVLIFERRFGSTVALIAVNKGSSSYKIENLYTSLPLGNYEDQLSGLLYSDSISVDSNGAVTSFELSKGEVGVWVYSDENSDISIGNIGPSIGISGNEVSISGTGFGSEVGQVYFENTLSDIVEWSDTLIKVRVPETPAGIYNVKVLNQSGMETIFSNFEILTATQVPVRFIVNNAETSYGENVYVVGNVSELGNWNPEKAVGTFFNSTATIAQYPSWFYDINLPVNTRIEYKFIKKNQSGEVTWESGSNHVLNTSTIADTFIQNWQK